MNQNENMGVELTLTEENESTTAMYDLSPEDFNALAANATVLDLDVGHPIEADTCVCCPERAEHWFQLQVVKNAKYSFSADVCVGARLYDAYGNLLASDNDDGEKNSFHINHELDEWTAYYLRVMPKLNHFMRFNTVITNLFTSVESISLTQDTLSLPPKHTWQLFSTVSPENATNKHLYWNSSDTSVATVDSNGKITTKNVGTAAVYVRAMDGSGVFAQCTVNVTDDYHYILNKSNDNTVSFKNDLDGALKGYNCRADVCVEPLVKSAKQIWKIEKILDTNNYYIKAYLDEEYGFNIRKSTFNCDLIKIAGNETDAKVCFVDQGNGYSKIRLVNYPEYYLTLISGGNDVKWDNTPQGDRQLWKHEIVDWDQYNAEHIEYHVLCGGDNTKALRVGTKNVLDISTDLPVRGERLSYWNRQKWTIKGNGNQKQICSQLDNEYFLCNDGAGNAYISDNAATVNSYLTITPYDADNDLYEIKLTQSGLYLTLEYNSTDALYWGKWKAYDSDFHETYQVWKLVEQPASHYHGVDTNQQIGDTTARVLKLNNQDFVVRYYANKENIYEENYDKILTSTEVTAIHNQGLKIVSIYEDGGERFSTERGTSDATEALRLATTFKQPSGSAIYFAVESDYSDQTILIQDYFKAVYEAFRNDGRYKVGVYGLAKVCKSIKDDLGYADVSWIAQSTYASNSSVEGDTNYIFYDSQEKYDIKQSEPVFYNGVKFDSDTAIRSNYGGW